MSLEMITIRLAVLQESNRQARELIKRLETIKFQPGSVPLAGDDDNIKTELNAEIAQILKDEEEGLELLQEQVLCLDTGHPYNEMKNLRDDLNNDVNREMRELQDSYEAFRKAQVTANKRLKLAQKLERQALVRSNMEAALASSNDPTERPPKRQAVELSQEEKELNASSDVTLALRRTYEMMSGELDRSQFAHDTLKQSTEALAQLSETYSTLDTLLSSSRNLLGTLLRSQKSDTWYLETAFYILLCTISWLVFRRFFYGPLWWLVYAPLRVSFSTLFGIFGLFRSKGESSIESANPGSSLTTSQALSSRSENARMNNGDVPAIKVSNGDQNLSPSSQATPYPSASTITEKVEQVIDESNGYESRREERAYGAQSEEDTLEDSQLKPEVESEKNPKKRMWEEPIQEAKEKVKVEQRKKDEL